MKKKIWDLYAPILRFMLIFSIYKLYDMIFFDYFLLMKFHFFQHYFPEVESVYEGRKYGYNIKSQLLKLLVMINHLYQPKGYFTPPYETEQSLRERLERMYTKAKITSVEGIACFRCRK